MANTNGHGFNRQLFKKKEKNIWGNCRCSHELKTLHKKNTKRIITMLSTIGIIIHT